MNYQEFVKENYPRVKHLPNNQRMTVIGKLWKSSGHAKEKGAGLLGNAGSVIDSIVGLGLKKRKKAHKRVEGKGLLGNVGNTIDSIVGLGLKHPLPVLHKKIGWNGLMAHEFMSKHSLNELLAYCAVKSLGHKKKYVTKNDKLAALQKYHEKGGDFLGSFLSGIATPFRVGASINPAFGFGVAQAADALGVPKIQDVIRG